MGTIAVADEASWLSVRESHVGGSEVACLFYRWALPDGQEVIRHLYEVVPEGAVLVECLSPYKTGYRLWLEKSGRLQPEKLDGIERIDAGTFLEPAIAEWAKNRWDWPLRKVRRYSTHPEVAGWGASLDYEVHEPGMPPVELKNVDGLVFRNDWLADGGEILMPPIHYSLQLQHQIGAVGGTHGWVVACVSGNQLMRGRIERHEPTQERIAQAIESFWNGVRGNIEPAFVADYESVAKANAYGTKGSQIDLTADEGLPVLCSRYLRIKRHYDRVDTVLANIKGRIAAKVGEANKAAADGYRISWPIVEREEKVIPERIQSAMTYRGALTVTKLKEAK